MSPASSGAGYQCHAVTIVGLTFRTALRGCSPTSSGGCLPVRPVRPTPALPKLPEIEPAANKGDREPSTEHPLGRGGTLHWPSAAGTEHDLVPACLPFAVSDHYVYMVRCADETLYTGYTTDPERRLSEHNNGEGAKYTRGRTPVELVYLECYDTQSAAMSREYELKQLRRAEKRRLIDGGTELDTHE